MTVLLSCFEHRSFHSFYLFSFLSWMMSLTRNLEKYIKEDPREISLLSLITMTRSVIILVICLVGLPVAFGLESKHWRE